MKRILAGALAALGMSLETLVSMAHSPRAIPGYKKQSRKASYTRYPATRFSAGSRTDAARYWHNRDNPHQADRIIAAESKRYARAAKRQFNTTTSVRNNHTTQNWNGPFPDRVCRNNLNPFYINRETV